MKSPELVLVIPVYNFASEIQNTFDQLTAWRLKNEANFSIRLVFVDDGSSDLSLKKLNEFQKQNALCDVVALHKNQGKGAAVRAGFNHAFQLKPEFIFFTDCDLHYGLEVITERMVQELKENEIVILDRSWVKNATHRDHLRKFLTGTFKRFVSILTGVNFGDTQAGLKGFQTVPARPLFQSLRLNGFSLDVEILSLACFYGYRIKQVPISFAIGHSFPETSTIHAVKSSFSMLFDLIKINWNWKRGIYRNPNLLKRVDDQIFEIRSTRL